MTNLEKLIELTEKFSKENEWGGVLTIDINDNRSSYETIKDSLISGLMLGNSDPNPSISQEDMACIEECEKKGMMCEIYFFNSTPVGHYRVFDSSVEGAALKMLKVFE